jgi:hypothetical protein
MSEENIDPNKGAKAALFIVVMAIIGALIGAELWSLSFLVDVIKVTR